MRTIQVNRMMQRMLALTLVLVSTLATTTLMAQDDKETKQEEKAAAVTAMINAQQYVFKAQTALPTRGRTVQLTTDYTVKVGKDTLVSDLPYFGRSFSAPIDPTKGGIQFNSTKFTYDVKEIKKGWQITIRHTDVSDVQQFFFSIFNNGSATLQVTSTNRTPITFNGFVVEKK
jgi:type II secretory pathway pseudopilin PulG